MFCGCGIRNLREWRNWQTRTFEGRVVHTVRVQVPFPAPKIDRFRPVDFFFKNGDYAIRRLDENNYEEAVMNFKKPLQLLALFVLPFWALLSINLGILTFADESMMIFVLFAIVIVRSLLWVSPIYLSAVSWIICYIKSKSIATCAIYNLILLAINFLFFYWTYRLTGRWY